MHTGGASPLRVKLQLQRVRALCVGGELGAALAEPL